MNKVIVTGASGLLGRAVVKEFKEKGWDVHGLAFSRATDQLIKVDLNNESEVENIFQNIKPHAVIHCAAQRFPEKVKDDFENSRKLNVECSKFLAKMSDRVGALFLYISTDYVFDGICPPFKETDVPNPLNKYGQTKYDGEIEVRNVNSGSLILRIPVLYGDESYMGESAVSSLFSNILSNIPCKVSDYEIRYPSHANDIAVICHQILKVVLQCSLEAQSNDPEVREKARHVLENSKTVHWCGKEALTKYKMCKIMADAFSLSSSHIDPDDSPSTGAPRPKDSRLSCEVADNLGIGQHTNFSDGIYKSYKKLFS